MDDLRKARWLVAGRVQGVGYRWFVRNAALRLGVRGDVRNLADGRVEVRAAGEADHVEALLDRLRQGPPGARVDAVEPTATEPDWTPESEGFGIRR